MANIQGVAVSPGLASGPLHVVRARPGEVPSWSVRPEDVPREIARLEEAVEGASHQLQEQEDRVRRTSGEQDAGIFAVHRMILQDPGALQTVEKSVRTERINAEAAVQALIRKLHKDMGKLEGDSVRRYGADLSEPWQGVLDLLLSRDQETLASNSEPVILAAEELTPQVVTLLDRERVIGIITQTGGRFSHGAVLARSFGIPCVVELPNLMARLEQDMQVIVDGDHGRIRLSPSDEDLEQFEVSRKRRSARRRVFEAEAREPAVTPDGHAFSVQVNMESLYDLDYFDGESCDGVGLLRTEFLYMERSQFPSEEEQFRLYRSVLERMEGRPVVLRTLDIGGDKQLPYFTTPKEANPQLGWRGLRISLEWQDLLRVQLRAALRASVHGDLRVLLPMVTSLEEVRAVREIFGGVREQLITQGYEVVDDLPVGIMVEVPSTIWILDEIAAEVDFVSVGTNDLTQYLLAVDRDNPLVARLYEPHHPAVGRALAQIARTCNAAGTPCGVCGEIASDFASAILLMGLGYQSISVTSNFLAEVRFAIRHTPFSEAQELAELALAATTAAEMREVLAGVRDRLHARSVATRDSGDAVGPEDS